MVQLNINQLPKFILLGPVVQKVDVNQQKAKCTVNNFLQGKVTFLQTFFHCIIETITYVTFPLDNNSRLSKYKTLTLKDTTALALGKKMRDRPLKA